jgi:general secretion pathway protein L
MPQNAMTEALLSRPTVAAGQFLRRAVGWWLTELAEMAPRPLARPLGRLLGRPPPDNAMLDLTAGQAFLLLQERGRAAPLSVALDDAHAAQRGRVAALLRRRRARDGVTVRIDPAPLFVTTLDLPRAAERTLDPVVRHQVERMLPLPAAQTCLAWRALPRPAGAATLKVAVAVAKQATVERALATARGLGLTPRLIIAPVAEAGPAPLVIWRADRAQAAAAPRRRRLLRGLEAAALALALAAYGLHVHRLEQVRAGLQDAVWQARQTAEATRDLGQRVAQSADALAFLRARRQAPQPLQVLDGLTRLLPLDTWVSDLTLRGETVEIVGSAPRATDLIALIEASDLFGHAQFRSPITLLPDGHAERFDLMFAVKGGKPP